MLTILRLIEIAARQKKNWHRRWASLPLTKTIVCVGPSSSSSPSAQSSPSVHRHIPSHRFISSSSALSSFAVHRARRPMCRNLRGNSISNSKWTAFTYVGISILSLFRSRGTNVLHSVVSRSPIPPSGPRREDLCPSFQST